MRRYRRMVLTDRIIPFLAAFVGLLALAGAVIVQVNNEAQTRRLGDELSAMRASIEQLTARADTLAAADDDGTAEGLLALQDRMVKLEAEWEEMPQVAAAPAPAGGMEAVALAGGGAEAEGGRATPAVIDPDWPTENCIPAGTRFMVTPGDSVAICQTPAVVKVSAITSDQVMLEGAGLITEAGFGDLPGTTCSASVFSADAEGFAEMRVACR